MENPTQVDLSVVASKLSVPEGKVQAAVELMDDGNTIPFITRYRKDQVGGIGERTLRSIKSEVTRLRNLQERKAIIIKSIENQGQLDDDLRKKIEEANSSRQLEDLYLPFKPKKQTHASVARQQGLEPLARDVYDGANPDVDLATRAMDFVRVDKGLENIDDVYKGVQHLLAERFSDNIVLRKELRDVFLASGKLTCSLIEQPDAKSTADDTKDDDESSANTEPAETAETESVSEAATEASTDVADTPETTAAAEKPEQPTSESEETEAAAQPGGDEESESAETHALESKSEGDAAESESESKSETVTVAADAETQTTGDAAEPKKKPKKKKKKKKKPDPFEEYKGFSELISKIPPHRILAINRGERAGRIKCRLVAEQSEIETLARKTLLDADHPFADFMWQAAEQAIARSIIPSIEREIRRESTENAEKHAVTVFARNLRHLLLQPPVTGQRILAIDPGFKSGCKAAALDELGNPLGHCVFPIVGNKQRRDDGKQALINLIKEHHLTLIAIGNGNGCRATEQFVSDLIANELGDLSIKYAIVNQAGASVYSTSEIGREELPDVEPVIRSAISIGRRLLDPLSELVKINPANIGVGMYQHDVKSKHLAESLEQEVESCVNFVGVNVNTSSSMLLKFISGVGQLTARRLVEHSKSSGPFKNREQLKDVPGFGQVTFVQAAGFLRIPDSDQLLDRTSIHPESYQVAEKIVEKIGGAVDELFIPTTTVQENTTPTTADEAASSESPPTTEEAPATPSNGPSAEELQLQRKRRSELTQKLKALDVAQLASELKVGEILVKDILRALKRPLRDPREDLPAPVFRKGIIKVEDLKPEMQLRGQVVNVVDFGVFVDIGIGESCLIHISRLSNRFVRDPHWLFSVGDVINVWVQEVDKNNRRVTLTAVRPQSAKPTGKPDSRRDSGKPGSSRFKQKGHGKRGKRHGSTTYQTKRKAKPKPVQPITQAMAEGKEPMRSFSDLLQFHQKKSDKDDKKT